MLKAQATHVTFGADAAILPQFAGIATRYDPKKAGVSVPRVVQRQKQSQMPTAARAIAAIGVAGVGAWAAWQSIGHLDATVRHPWFITICALSGIVLGWATVGTEVGRGWYTAIRAGLRAGMYLALVGLGYLGVVMMIARSMRRLYHTPLDALIDVFGQAFKIGEQLFTFDVISVLFLGGIVSGILAEWANRRWS